MAKLDAAPGNCVQESGPIAFGDARRGVNEVIALAGSLAVTGIGGGTIACGETDLGKSMFICAALSAPLAATPGNAWGPVIAPLAGTRPAPRPPPLQAASRSALTAASVNNAPLVVFLVTLI